MPEVFAGWQVEDYAGRDVSAGRPEPEVAAAVLECSAQENDPGIALARRIRRQNQNARIVIIAVGGSEDLAVEALRIGAADYLKPPVDLGRLARALGENESVVSLAARRIGGVIAAGAIVGESPAILRVKQFLPKVAASDTNVLITGETGTGKEMIAEQIHALGSRNRKQFVSINCSAIPDSLIESELFGYERGAFTGSWRRRMGVPCSLTRSGI
jgi:two-component system, NtrC family, C4-dicarboxylate transport response regulator DctD